MTSNRTVSGWLAALALVAVACGGGGAEPALLAAADVPIVPEVADDAPPAAEGEVVEEVVEEAPPPPPAVAAEEEPEPSYTYADDGELAATMVLLPADLAGVLPTLRADAAHTGPVADFHDYSRGVLSAAWGDATPSRPLAVYGALLVGDRNEAARLRHGSAYPDVFALETEVAYYGDAARVDARLAEMRAGYEGLTEAVSDQPGVAGDGFTAVLDDRVVVGLAGHGTVGKVTAYGTESPDAAVAAASLLGVRMWQASAGMLEPRDPAAHASGYRLPTQVLDNFSATSDVVVSAAGEVLERWRWTGTYEGPGHWSCQLTHYADGTESLEADVVVAAGTAAVFDGATMSSGQYPMHSPEVAAAAWLCPVLPEGWRGLVVADPSVLESDPASTSAGPGTTLRARDQWRLEWAALGADFADGEQLEDFSLFVAADGWATAVHAESSFPRSTAEEFYGGNYGAVERVTVRESVKVTAVEGVEVPEPLYFVSAGEFEVGLGEEVEAPLFETAPAPAAAPAPAPEGEVQAAGQVGDGQVAADDGLFGTGIGATPSDGSGFIGEAGGPIDAAQDVATQDAVRLTMIGLVAYYEQYGHYNAEPTDVMAFALGASTTDDPAQAGSYATVYVPGGAETVVYGQSASGTWYCVALAANQVIVYNKASTQSAVDSPAECGTNGTLNGW